MSTSFDIKTIVKQIDNNVIKAVNKALEYLEIKIDDNTPIDTGEYQRGNKKIEAKKIGQSIRGVLYNDSTNAEEVEYGFSSKKLNWWKHKKRGGPMILENSQGARVYTRAFDLEQEKVKEIIKNNL